MRNSAELPVAVVRGAGDLGTGAALRLWRAGFRVVCLDVDRPLVIRRSVAFASALYEADGQITVEGVEAVRVQSAVDCAGAWARGCIPVLADPQGAAIRTLAAPLVVDCVLSKTNAAGTRITDAPVVIACGPGFTAGVDCHAVVETNRGHALGRVLWSGPAEPNTGRPGKVGGEDEKRVLRAPVDGIFLGRRRIGDLVAAGDIIATVEGEPVTTQLTGVLRGLLHDGLMVKAGLKVADVDPRSVREHCFTVSDKAWSIAGGVLEAALSRIRVTGWTLRES